MIDTELVTAISSFATAAGVAIAVYQLWIVKKQAATTFEDSLNSQYRSAIERIPLEALLGEKLKPGDIRDLLPHFYRYFDLCNEQAFLRQHGRITTKTWKNWEEGIKSNLQRPAFAVAWAEIARRASDDFSSLKALCPPTVRSSDIKIDT